VTDLFNRGPEYRCISMDPPWAERGGGKIKRGADRHYPLMDKVQILSTLRESGKINPAEHAHLWCWYTDNFLSDALWLVHELGFVYKRTYIWVKTQDDEPLYGDEWEDSDLRMGIGQYARGCHEGLILATHGKGQDESVWTQNRSVRSVFHASHATDEQGKRIHSRKPPKSYDLIESVSKGPRLECFARVARPGWDVWGNQAP
jgi:N6-adenosine-specific RNA methylase IME4